MPKETREYYRYSRQYTPEQVSDENFQLALSMDEDSMNNNLPDDCNGLYFSFSYEDEISGNFRYDYFEREEDMIVRKAVIFKDESIYKDWLKGRKEDRELHNYKKDKRYNNQ